MPHISLILNCAQRVNAPALSPRPRDPCAYFPMAQVITAKGKRSLQTRRRGTAWSDGGGEGSTRLPQQFPEACPEQELGCLGGSSVAGGPAQYFCSFSLSSFFW